MGKINYRRVILGGLLAGVVINIFEMLMMEEWLAALKAAGVSWEMTQTDMIVFPLLSFVTGIAAVWLYAVARPRFGPGPKTAACVGIAYGIIGYAIPGIAWGMTIRLPAYLLAMGIVWGVVEATVATVVGAWPYKE